MELKDRTAIPGVKQIITSDPLVGTGRAREKRVNSTTGEILTNRGGGEWVGTQGTLIQSVLASSHPNLMAFWTMDNVSGSTYFDETTNNYDLTASSVISVAGKIGNAADFTNGTGKLETLNTAPFYALGSGAISFWAKSQSGQDAVRAFTISDASRSATFWAASYDNTGKLIVHGGGFSLEASGGSEGVWTHFCVQSDGATLTAYRDGVEVTLTPTTGSNSGQWFDHASTSATHVTLGLVNLFPDILGGGDLDHVRVFDRVMTQGEITELASEVSYP